MTSYLDGDGERSINIVCVCGGRKETEREGMAERNLASRSH